MTDKGTVAYGDQSKRYPWWGCSVDKITTQVDESIMEKPRGGIVSWVPRQRSIIPLVVCLSFMFCACEKREEMGNNQRGNTAPTKFTEMYNQEVADSLPLADQTDFKQATRGFIASIPDLVVTGEGGKTVFDQKPYQFIKGDAPASVNPSLWRQAKLNDIHGLFELTKGVYQLRGFDLANMTIIEGKSGWIIVDSLTSKETASTALAFARKHLGEKPIRAIIFTHSHVDHFGGATGILTQAEVVKNKVRVIAPIGFMEEAVSENVMAGMVMARRSLYMYGRLLPVSDRGHVGSGLGKAPAMGLVGILRPTEVVSAPQEEKVIDGVRFVFQNVPSSEAPAEFVFYLPENKILCGAEIVSRNMHNLYTLRGAKVRDALKWSNYIDHMIDSFGDAEIYFGVHHWPIWGNAEIIDFLKKQRDIYKYIHDQTMRLAYEGLTPNEIAEEIEFPESLRTEFSNRGYYGTLRHNAKAVYQFYFGWYDGNPADLNPLPPEASAVKYVEFMGGADAVLIKARQSFDKGEYRWTAQVLNHLVFAEPDNEAAKALLAKTYDQLGYQAESGPWRDNYLTGAYELRHGKPEKAMDIGSALELLSQTPISHFLDSMAARLNGPKADGKNIKINVIFTDLNESYVLNLENAVMHHKKASPDPTANATVKLTHDLYLRMAIGKAGISDLLTSDDIEYEGSKLDLIRFFSLFEMPKGAFNIVTP